MKRIILFTTAFFTLLIAQAKIQEAYILPGDKIIFKVNTVKSVYWFWQKNQGDAWQQVSGKNVYVHEANQGQLFAAILQGNNKVSFTDTIQFITPHANAATGFMYDGRFYKTVELNGNTWMAEDLGDSTFTYAEALDIERNTPGWKLPSPNLVNNSAALNPFVSQTAYTSIWNRRWNAISSFDRFHDSMAVATGEHELWEGQNTGFNAVPNVFNETRYKDDFEKYGAFYWFYQGRNPAFADMLFVPNTNYPISRLESEGGPKRDYQHVNFSESAIRLVKEQSIDNRPPDETKQLWPFDGLEQVNKTPTITWEPVSDPDGDKVFYYLSLNHQFGNPTDNRRVVTDTNAFSFTDPLPDGAFYQWTVYAYDEHGFYTYLDVKNGNSFRYEFRVAQTGETPKTNPGDYGIQQLTLLEPGQGDNIYNNRVRISWEEFTNKSRYKIYLSKEDPPAYAGFENQGRTYHYSDPLEGDTKYYLQVKAIDDDQSVLAESSTISFTTVSATEGVTTIDDEEQEDDKGEPKTYSGGTNATDSDGDFFDIVPADGSVHCITIDRSRGYSFVHLQMYTRISGRGEFRLYMRPVNRAQTQGWQVFTLDDFNHPTNGLRIVGAGIDVENLDISGNNEEMEWKIVFYDATTKKEVKASKVRRFTLQEPVEYQFKYITANETSEMIRWSEVKGAEGYALNFKEMYRDCYECRTSVGCLRPRYFSELVTDTFATMPALNKYTDYYEVEVRPAGGACWVRKPAFGDDKKTFHNELPPLCPEENYKTVTKNKDEDGDGSPTSGGGGSGTKIYSNTPIVVTYQTSVGNWKAVGPLQNVSADPSEEYVINQALYTCQKNTHQFYKSCGKYRIYILNVCDMGLTEEDGEKAINRVHSYLLNNGCNAY